MSDVPSELKYTDSHEWVRVESDGSVTVGITQHAQHLLGDMVFVELPEVGTVLKSGDDAGVVESVKAASDYYAPIAGEIVEVNEAVLDAPSSVNTDPYGDGWLMRIKPSDASEIEQLMDAAAYGEQVAEEE